MLDTSMKPEIRSLYHWMYAVVSRGHEMTDHATGEVYCLTNNDLDTLSSMWVDVLNEATYDTLGRVLRAHIDANPVMYANMCQRLAPELRFAIRSEAHRNTIYQAYVDAVRCGFPALANLDSLWFEAAFDLLVDLWVDNQTIDDIPHNNPDGTFWQ